MFKVSLGKSRADNCPCQKSFESFKDLVSTLSTLHTVPNNAKELGALPYICAPMKLSEKGGRGRRCTANALPYSIAMVDVDTASVGVVEEFCKPCDLEYLLYTTWSHTAETPKFRLFISLAKPMVPCKSVILQAVQALASVKGFHIEEESKAHICYASNDNSALKFELDTSCFDPARLMFLPVNTNNKTALVHYSQGKPVEVSEPIAPAQVYSPPTKIGYSKEIDKEEIRDALYALAKEGFGELECDWSKMAMALSNMQDKELAWTLLCEYSSAVGGDTTRNREKFEGFCKREGINAHPNTIITYAIEECTGSYKYILKRLKREVYKVNSHKLFKNISKLSKVAKSPKMAELCEIINSMPYSEVGSSIDIHHYMTWWGKAVEQLLNINITIGQLSEDDKDFDLSNAEKVLVMLVESHVLDLSKFLMLEGRGRVSYMLNTRKIKDSTECIMPHLLRSLNIQNLVALGRSNMKFVKHKALVPTALYPAESPLYKPEGAGVAVYNTWEGLTVRSNANPNKAVKDIVDNFLSIVVKKGICLDNDKTYAKLMEWFARKTLRPWDRIKAALVVYGAQGTGKDVTVDNFGALLGNAYMVVEDMEQLAGRFSTIVDSHLLVNASEIAFAKNRALSSKLKTKITASEMKLERKFNDEVQVKAYYDIYMTTNDHHAINMVEGMFRRTILFKVNEAATEHLSKEDWEKYAGIKDNKEALAYLLHVLTTVPIPEGAFKVEDINEHLKTEQAEYSMEPHEALVLDLWTSNNTLIDDKYNNQLFNIEEFDNANWGGRCLDSNLADLRVPISVIKNTIRLRAKEYGPHVLSRVTEAYALFKQLCVASTEGDAKSKYKEIKRRKVLQMTSTKQFAANFEKYYRRKPKEEYLINTAVVK